jgi:hypothetical protein
MTDILQRAGLRKYLSEPEASATVSNACLSEPEASATVASLRRRTQTFIAYLYKPEAQAKVFQMPVYHSHINPSLALQACKPRIIFQSRK